MKLPPETKAMEPPPVPKRRGRPPKQRRTENGKVTDVPKKPKPIVLIGRYVLKQFPKRARIGKVVSYKIGLYRVEFENRVSEDLDSGVIRKILLEDCDLDLDDGLIKRKKKLDGLLSRKIDEAKKKKKSSELREENDKEQDVMGEVTDDSMDLCSKAETRLESPMLDLPPKLELPPSSRTIGVPENYVSHLFSVYAFLRSFSIRLFLSPFTLDDFVGALNCRVSNTLLDAVHVSLLRALKRHLESLSAEGSKIASKCLRYSDWSLLDALTWPVFLIQYVTVNGYTKGSEWKGFYNEILCGEYYSLPASRKLMILQILCEEVLESEELKAEMNMREESEVGKNYDAEDIPHAENEPKGVHRRHAKTADCQDEESLKSVSKLDAVNLPGNSEDEVDNNGDECRLCGMDGTLLCCDGCPAVYHSRCIGVMKMYIPEGEWYCPECKINMTGPTIARGTSLKGAEIFGMDLYGQLFMGTCDHLLVLNDSSSEFCLKYYNQIDIPEVIRVLYASMQHRHVYSSICTAVLQYWNISESFLLPCVPNGVHINSEYSKIDEDTSAALLPHVVENDHKDVSFGKPEYSLASVDGICSDNMVPSLDASLVTSSPTRETSDNTITKESPSTNMKLQKETVMSSGVFTVNHQSDTNCQNPDNRSNAAILAKCSSVSNQFITYGHANDMGLPMNLSLQTKGDQTGFGKGKGNITNDFVYMGCSYKPQSYINYYMHGDFAASAAANLAILSSVDSRSEGHVTDLRRATSENTNLLEKAFSLTVSCFVWPSSDKKLAEVPRERCGWCLSCKAPASSKKGCMLNHAAICATQSAVRIFSGLAPVRSGEGIGPTIATYVIYMEESLHGLIDGPFLSGNYRKQWREHMERATSFNSIKPLLLKLEENIRSIAFCGEWLKLTDEWLVESLTIQSATSILGTTETRASCDRCRKQPIKYAAGPCRENFGWRNSKFTKSVFQKAALPKYMVRRAARQGGSKKILSIIYPDSGVSEIPKRSRQLIWRAAVQMSRSASQLALQVRYLDLHIRWIDLIRPEYNLQDGKVQDTEVSALRNANICDKKREEGKTSYDIDFGSKKHIPSRVLKNAKIVQGPKGEKYWFSETRIPLYLIKEYEVSNEKKLSYEDNLNIASQWHKKRLNAIFMDIFSYLTHKRDNLDMPSCSVCKQGVLFRNALKCSACLGYCHEGCSIIPAFPMYTDAEFLTTCKQCYHTRLLTQKEINNKSPTSPLSLKGHEHSSLTILKGLKPKCDNQILLSTRAEDCRSDIEKVASYSSMEAKSSRRKSWGIIWKKNNSEDTGLDFRLKKIILKRRTSLPQLEPVCHLCQMPYRPDLMYIGCETCTRWYHAEALELEESKIFSVLGFKCCKCRKIKSPACPYSQASKKKDPGADSGSGTLADTRASEPDTPIFPAEEVCKRRTLADARASEPDTPIFPAEEVSKRRTLADARASEPDTPIFLAEEVSKRRTLADARASGLDTPIFPAEEVSKKENNPLSFSLSNVELIAEPNFEVDAGIESNLVSGSVLQKMPTRSHFKPEGDSNGSFGGQIPHAGISDEMDNLPAEVFPPFVEQDSLSAHYNFLNYSEIEANEYTEFETESELMDIDFEEAYAPGDLSGIADSCTLDVPEELASTSLNNNQGPTISSNRNVHSCAECSQTEPAPDLNCEDCPMRIHKKCSRWIESSSMLEEEWKCGNCRNWS
ncbi:DDT domain-containing protein PTM isoform X2 [Lathyrus oleraceus]|uniref:DDT domain-containing protein PTM isoform X2 n=1 Tax=Pisum sativum TaxID=3888 RepID=UPI001FC3F2FA|nr:DDT domain-containing protein PTM-like isoform X2 [Pisum sativum]